MYAVEVNRLAIGTIRKQEELEGGLWMAVKVKSLGTGRGRALDLIGLASQEIASEPLSFV
jgi:hypothetical protein